MAVTREQALQSLEFKNGAFVVDVGGGHRPFARADVVFEKHPFGLDHRIMPLVHSAPVLIVDGTKMPIPRAGCDAVFASHVIEHMPDPGAFIRELKRCAEWTYLEFPSRIRELMFAWSFHEWLVVADGHHLIFYKNDIPQLFADFFHRGYDAVFDAWNLQRHDDLNDWTYCRTADLTWELASESAFEHALALSPRGSARCNEAARERVDYSWSQLARLAVEKLLPPSTLASLIRVVQRRRQGEIRPVTEALVKRLMCRKCEGTQLRLETETIRCGSCGTIYQKRQGLFDFDV
jgi:hypothetical protein